MGSILFAYGLYLLWPAGAAVNSGGFIGPDSYTRILMVQQTVAGGDWFDPVLQRFNAPFGMAMHWTKPMDAAILALAYPVHWVTGQELVGAVAWSGYWVSPLIGGGVLVAIAITLHRYGAAGAWVLMPILLITQPALTVQMALGRPDHHALQLLCMAAMLAAFALIGKKTAQICGLLAAIAVVLAVWISPEGLIQATFAVGFLVLAFWWVRDVAYHDAARWFAIAVLVIAPFALAAERGLEFVWQGDPQRFSWLQVLFLYLCASGILLVLRLGDIAEYSWKRWGILIGFALAAIAVAVGSGAVEFSHKAYIDERTRDLLFDTNREFQPMLGGASEIGQIIHHLFGLAMGLLLTAGLVWRRGIDRSTQATLALGCAVLVFYGVLALFVSIRWVGYAQIVGLAAMALILHLAMSRIPSVVLKTACCLGLIVMPLSGLVAKSADASKSTKERECAWPELGRMIAEREGALGGGGKRWTILAPIFRGPETAWYAQANIVAGPYGQPEPLLDTFEAFSRESDERLASLVKRRAIDWVVVCAWDDGEYAAVGDGSVHDRLQKGAEFPDWLNPVQIESPESDNGLRLYRVAQTIEPEQEQPN